jgi:hypothetical protein
MVSDVGYPHHLSSYYGYAGLHKTPPVLRFHDHAEASHGHPAAVDLAVDDAETDVEFFLTLPGACAVNPVGAELTTGEESPAVTDCLVDVLDVHDSFIQNWMATREHKDHK